MASLMRVLALTVGLIFVGSAAPAFAKGATCVAAKTQAECGKKTGCAWNGKACAANKAAKAKTAAKPAKAKKETAKAKPGKAGKAGKKEPAVAAPAAPAAAEEETSPVGDDMPPPEGESEEDF